MRVVALLLALAACAHAAPQATQPNTAAQVIAADSVARRQLAAVAQVAPSIRQEVRYATRNNFTGEVLPGYGVAVVLLRREAAEALGRVQARLAAKGMGLKIWDGYRPVRATLAMVAWCERTGQTKLLDDGYIARRSRHNQGVAVDLTLVELGSGREFDMGTPFDEFSARSHTANATGVVAANRQLLVQAMAAEGFTNYVDEWWHFSFAVPDAVPYDLPLERW
ncbi:MAG: D-alanyl-D-alanine carboxypeptidase family protein [Gemmatimonadetes bacterium]|jgi:D-alanyl-D-alanine dipeptidase|nr:D-alanyl-D-alanine carboxypeptidase family protein [Gemmatimonadota bacterium]